MCNSFLNMSDVGDAGEKRENVNRKDEERVVIVKSEENEARSKEDSR